MIAAHDETVINPVSRKIIGQARLTEWLKEIWKSHMFSLEGIDKKENYNKSIEFSQSFINKDEACEQMGLNLIVAKTGT